MTILGTLLCYSLYDVAHCHIHEGLGMSFAMCQDGQKNIEESADHWWPSIMVNAWYQ